MALILIPIMRHCHVINELRVTRYGFQYTVSATLMLEAGSTDQSTIRLARD